MQAEAKDVDRRLEQVRRGAVGQHGDGPIGRDQPPVAVDDDGRVRLVAAQEPVEHVAHRPHLGIVQVALRKRGRVAGREQECVAVTQRHVEMLGQLHDHLGARPRTAGLDEAHVARGDAGSDREVELAQATPLPPVAEQRADARAGGELGHGVTVAGARQARPYLRGHCGPSRLRAS